MTRIQLSRGYTAMIDDEDFERVSKYKWSSLPTKWTVYARRCVRLPNGRQHSVYLHRFIMNDPEGLEIDHIDRDGLNCQKSNLRLASKTQNQSNKGKYKNNTSGVPGVSWWKARKMWRADISVGWKKIHLGSFTSIVAAAQAYKDACDARSRGEIPLSTRRKNREDECPAEVTTSKSEKAA